MEEGGAESLALPVLLPVYPWVGVGIGVLDTVGVVDTKALLKDEVDGEGVVEAEGEGRAVNVFISVMGAEEEEGEAEDDSEGLGEWDDKDEGLPPLVVGAVERVRVGVEVSLGEGE
jgi:hypothetical protein